MVAHITGKLDILAQSYTEMANCHTVLTGLNRNTISKLKVDGTSQFHHNRGIWGAKLKKNVLYVTELDVHYSLNQEVAQNEGLDMNRNKTNLC